MGSLASWSASMYLIHKTSVKQNKTNSAEEIQNFVGKHKNHLYSSVNLKGIKKNDILLSVDIFDDEGDESDYVNLAEIGLENVNAKDFITNKVYKNYDEFDESYSDVSDWLFNIEGRNVEKALKNIDLVQVDKNIDMWNFVNPKFLTDTEYLASCGDDIYCGNDNSGSDEFKITQRFIDSLSVGDIIKLHGDGDGDNC
jgi:hypothetical protein